MYLRALWQVLTNLDGATHEFVTRSSVLTDQFHLSHSFLKTILQKNTFQVVRISKSSYPYWSGFFAVIFRSRAAPPSANSCREQIRLLPMWLPIRMLCILTARWVDLALADKVFLPSLIEPALAVCSWPLCGYKLCIDSLVGYTDTLHSPQVNGSHSNPARINSSLSVFD